MKDMEIFFFESDNSKRDPFLKQLSTISTIPKKNIKNYKYPDLENNSYEKGQQIFKDIFNSTIKNTIEEIKTNGEEIKGNILTNNNSSSFGKINNITKKN